jgi:hypothetical protein
MIERLIAKIPAKEATPVAIPAIVKNHRHLLR